MLEPLTAVPLKSVKDSPQGKTMTVVCAKDVAKPVAVRYAYTAQPRGHLIYNKDGMPVGPFSTSGDNATENEQP